MTSRSNSHAELCCAVCWLISISLAAPESGRHPPIIWRPPLRDPESQGEISTNAPAGTLRAVRGHSPCPHEALRKNGVRIQFSPALRTTPELLRFLSQSA
jgi:hypothetical protein